MARRFIDKLSGGERIDEVYVLQSIEIRAARNDTHYLVMTMSDRTGRIDARRWDASENLYQHLRTADFVRVSGRVEAWRNSLQIVVDDIRPFDGASLDLADFLPETAKGAEDLMRQLRETVESLEEVHVKALLLSFLDDAEFAAALRRAPAAVSYHHPFLGGLLEHICSVVWVTEQIMGHYPELSRDLMIAGVILHDIGKVRELAVGPSFKYSDEGELIGHVALGVLMVHERAGRIEGFPPELLMQIEHMILSHHGELEYGSPKVPMTIEAIALHHLDNLDAKINAFSMALRSDRQVGESWTNFNRMFGRRLYKANAAVGALSAGAQAGGAQAGRGNSDNPLAEGRHTLRKADS